MAVVIIPNDGVTVTVFDLTSPTASPYRPLAPGELATDAVNWVLTPSGSFTPAEFYREWNTNSGGPAFPVTPPTYTPSPKIFELAPTGDSEGPKTCHATAYPGLPAGLYVATIAVHHIFTIPPGATQYTDTLSFNTDASIIIQVVNGSAVTPPATPTSPSTPIICEGSERTLSWMPGSSPTAGAPDCYKIYVNGVFVHATADATVNSYLVTGLTIGTQYTFRVSAVNTAGESSLSVAVMSTPCPAPPTPPHDCYSREADCNSVYRREAISTTIYTREQVDCACDD